MGKKADDCEWMLTEYFGGFEMEMGCCNGAITFNFEEMDTMWDFIRYCPHCGETIIFDKEHKVIKRRYVREVESGDVGYIVGTVGEYCKAQFKVKGLYGFRSNLVGLKAYEIIDQETYNKTKKENKLCQRLVFKDSEKRVKRYSQQSQRGYMSVVARRWK